VCSARFTLKKNKSDNSCPKSARLSEEVTADDRDEYEFLLQASTVRHKHRQTHTMPVESVSGVKCVSFLQHYYSVRIFPGQEPSSVWVGWVTSDFHQYDPGFELHNVQTVTVTLGDEKGKVHERSVAWQPTRI